MNKAFKLVRSKNLDTNRHNVKRRPPIYPNEIFQRALRVAWTSPGQYLSNIITLSYPEIKMNPAPPEITIPMSELNHPEPFIYSKVSIYFMGKKTDLVFDQVILIILFCDRVLWFLFILFAMIPPVVHRGSTPDCSTFG